MKHTTKIELTNREDQLLAKMGIIKPESIRRVTVEDALVDTGATRLSLPTPLVEQLGLTPVGSTKATTTNGVVDRVIYSEVRFKLLEREGTIEVTNLPANAPVLVGHIVLEMLDLCVDIRKGLTYNPDHDDEWIDDAY